MFSHKFSFRCISLYFYRLSATLFCLLSWCTMFVFCLIVIFVWFKLTNQLESITHLISVRVNIKYLKTQLFRSIRFCHICNCFAVLCRDVNLYLIMDYPWGLSVRWSEVVNFFPRGDGDGGRNSPWIIWGGERGRSLRHRGFPDPDHII
jgi:hypothetical protein